MEFDLYLNEYFASIGDFFEKNNPKLRLAACKAIEYIQKFNSYRRPYKSVHANYNGL